MKKLLIMFLTFIMLFSSVSFYTYGHPFKDVANGSWYEHSVSYCYEQGLLKGVAEDSFDPNGIVSREQFVQALANKEGIDTSEYTEAAKAGPFIDVAPDKWYSGAIEWARSNNIVAGISETTFGLGKSVTREQMAAMLVRYAAVKGCKTDYKADLDFFTDKDEISSWALDGVSYACATGLFKGNDKGEFSPKGEASRAELAAVLQRIDTRSKKRIVCYGDSLTMGIQTGFEDIAEYPYPERLGQYLGVEAINYGIGAETSDMIAMRQGAVPVYAVDMTIPSECEPVLLNYIIEGADEFSVFGMYGFEGVNDCEIAGVKGKITSEDGGNDRYNTEIYFTRNEPGEQVVITERERIITFAMSDKREDDILVIWSGSNDLHGAVDLSQFDIITGYIDKMIEYSETDKYVIIGYTANDYLGHGGFTECTDLYNEKLLEKYGEKFVNVKSYLASYEALSDNGIIPTERDIERLQKGWIPYSLLDESNFPVHFNQIGYDIIADMVADKIIELGYLN